MCDAPICTHMQGVYKRAGIAFSKDNLDMWLRLRLGYSCPVNRTTKRLKSTLFTWPFLIAVGTLRVDVE